MAKIHKNTELTLSLNSPEAKKKNDLLVISRNLIVNTIYFCHK